MSEFRAPPLSSYQGLDSKPKMVQPSKTRCLFQSFDLISALKVKLKKKQIKIRLRRLLSEKIQCLSTDSSKQRSDQKAGQPWSPQYISPSSSSFLFRVFVSAFVCSQFSPKDSLTGIFCCVDSFVARVNQFCWSHNCLVAFVVVDIILVNVIIIRSLSSS